MKKSEGKSAVKKLSGYIRPVFLKWLIGSLCDIVGLSIFSVLTASALEDFINASAKMEKAFFFAGLGKLGAALLVMFVFEGLYKRCFLEAISHVRISLRRDLFRKMIRSPYGRGQGENVQEQMVHLNQDVETALGFVGEKLISLCSSFCMSVVAVVCIGLKSWELGLLCFVSLILIVTVNLVYRPRQQDAMAKVIEQNGEINGVFADALTGGITIRTNGLQPFMARIFDKKAEGWFAAKRRERRLYLQQGLLGNGLSKATILAVLFMGTLFCADGRLLVGSLFYMFQFALNLVGYAEQVCGSFMALSKSYAGVDRVCGILDAQDEEDCYGEDMAPEGDVEIRLKDVCVKYSGRTVLDGINFEAGIGDYIAITGESGAGKSTLLNVLLGFADHEGEYLINGKKAGEYRKEEFRKLFSYVSQKPELFHCSIRDNLLYGNPDATEEEMREAARAAGAEDFIEQLEEKYDTVLEEGGGNLSGGEKQRISVARAFLKKAPILIMDEGTSALDQEKENVVIESLEKLRENKLVLVVAHRQNMIQAAERRFEIRRA